MSRYPAERHNDEFRRLYEASGLTKEQISELIGVSLHSVLQWTKPTTTKNSMACPKHRVDTLKVALGLKLRDLNDSQRARVLSMLKG
jgi:transposase